MQDISMGQLSIGLTLVGIGLFGIAKRRNNAKCLTDIDMLEFALSRDKVNPRLSSTQRDMIAAELEVQRSYLQSYSIIRPRVDWIRLDIPGFQAHLWPVNSRQ